MLFSKFHVIFDLFLIILKYMIFIILEYFVSSHLFLIYTLVIDFRLCKVVVGNYVCK